MVREYATAERVPDGILIDETLPVREEGDVTIIPVMEERLVVRRELVLVEEVHITRRRETRALDQEVTLRRERVVVERFDPDRNAWQPADPPSASGAAPPTGVTPGGDPS
jgi:stress response protein YsnF